MELYSKNDEIEFINFLKTNVAETFPQAYHLGATLNLGSGWEWISKIYDFRLRYKITSDTTVPGSYKYLLGIFSENQITMESVDYDYIKTLTICMEKPYKYITFPNKKSRWLIESPNEMVTLFFYLFKIYFIYYTSLNYS